MLPHPAGHVGQHNVSTFDFYPEARICQGLCHNPFNFQRFFLLFCHTLLACLTTVTAATAAPQPTKSSPFRPCNPIILASSWLAGPARMLATGRIVRVSLLATNSTDCNDKSALQAAIPPPLWDPLLPEVGCRYLSFSGFAVQLIVSGQGRRIAVSVETHNGKRLRQFGSLNSRRAAIVKLAPSPLLHSAHGVA